MNSKKLSFPAWQTHFRVLISTCLEPQGTVTPGRSLSTARPSERMAAPKVKWSMRFVMAPRTGFHELHGDREVVLQGVEVVEFDAEAHQMGVGVPTGCHAPGRGGQDEALVAAPTDADPELGKAVDEPGRRSVGGLAEECAEETGRAGEVTPPELVSQAALQRRAQHAVRPVLRAMSRPARQEAVHRPDERRCRSVRQGHGRNQAARLRHRHRRVSSERRAWQCRTSPWQRATASESGALVQHATRTVPEILGRL